MRKKVVALVVVNVVIFGLLGYYVYDLVWGSTSHLRAARQALESNDFPSARRHLTIYLKARPTNPEGHLLAARTARRALMPVLPTEQDDAGDEPDADDSVGSFADAESHLAAFAKHGGEPELERFERYLLRAQSGDLDEVEGELLALARKETPEAPLILEALAKGNLVRLRLREALVCIEMWLKAREEPQALLWRAWIQERWRKPELAIDDYRRCLQLAPDNLEARRRLAGHLVRSDADEALQHYRELLQRRPGETEYVLGSARCEAALGGHDAARQRLQGILQAHPNHLNALVELGTLELDQTGQLETAENYLRRAVELAPWHHQANLLLYRCLGLENRTEPAARQLARLQDIEADISRMDELASKAVDAPHDAGVRFESGALMLCNGREKAGLRCLQSALQEDPKHEMARQLLEQHTRLGKAPEFQRQLHATLADHYERLSLPDLAARHRRQARE